MRLPLASILVIAALIGATSGSRAAFVDPSDSSTNSIEAAATFCTRSVQSGTTTSSTNGVTSAAITPVDSTKAFLVFSSRHASNRPVGSVIRGRLNGAGTAVEFVRVTNEGTPVAMTMAWYVVEYACGVRVQRGEIAPSATVVNVPIAAVASTSQAFVTWSKTPTATDTSFDSNDFLLGELTSTSMLQLRTNSGASTHMVAWQVIEFLDAADVSVQTGTTSMTGTTTSTTDTIPVAVDLSRTFLLVGYRSGGSGTDIGSRMIRAELTDPTTISVSRQVSGSPDDITEITWQVVELLDGSTVQSGTQHFNSGIDQHDVAITPVDTSRAWAFGSVQSGSGQNLGESSYVGDDVIGVGAFATELTANLLTLRRSSTVDAADVTWFVVD